MEHDQPDGLKLLVSGTVPGACQGRFTALSCLSSTYETAVLRLAWPQQALYDARSARPAEASQGSTLLTTAGFQLGPARHAPTAELWLADLTSRWSAIQRSQRRR